MTIDDLFQHIKALTNRLEALENQLYAQKLLSDELESTVETLKQQLTPAYTVASPRCTSGHVWASCYNSDWRYCIHCGISMSQIVYTGGSITGTTGGIAGVAGITSGYIQGDKE